MAGAAGLTWEVLGPWGGGRRARCPSCSPSQEPVQGAPLGDLLAAGWDRVRGTEPGAAQLLRDHCDHPGQRRGCVREQGGAELASRGPRTGPRDVRSGLGD